MLLQTWRQAAHQQLVRFSKKIDQCAHTWRLPGAGLECMYGVLHGAQGTLY